MPSVPKASWTNAVHAGDGTKIWSYESHDAKSSIDAAAHYLRGLIEKIRRKSRTGAGAYNLARAPLIFSNGCDRSSCEREDYQPTRLITGGVPPYPETQQYVRSAIALLANTRFNNATGDLYSRSSGSALRFF